MTESDNDSEGGNGAGAVIAAQIVGSALQNGFNLFTAAKQREWSEAMLNKQNLWNLQQWERSNLYNSPQAQLERLREAGLNPLFYGLDGSSSNALQSAQPIAYERAQFGNFINPLMQGLSAEVQRAQISNIQADTSKKLNESLTETQRRENMQADLALAKQELNNRLAEEGLTDAQRQRVLKDIGWIDRINTAIVSEKESSAKLDDSQRRRITALVEGEKLIQAKTVEDFEHRWNKIDAEIKKMSAETGLLEEDLVNYALNHVQNGFAGTGLSLPNLFRLERFQKKNRSDLYSSSESGVR